MDDATRQALDAAKQASFGQLLFRCARLLDAIAVDRIRGKLDLPELRPAHTALFPHLDLDGTRPTELARRMGISKQAVGQLVDDLERMGVLERVSDPSDRRARLVRFVSRDGLHVLLEGLGQLGTLEAELTAAIGTERAGELHEALTALLPELERRHPE